MDLYNEDYFVQFDWIIPDKFNEIVVSRIFGKRVLDYGCGNGTLGEEIAKYANTYLGIDVSNYSFGEMVRKNLDCIILDKFSFFKLRNSFDICCLFDVVEHMKDLDIAILLDSIPKHMILSTPLHQTPDETHINVKDFNGWVNFFNNLHYSIEKIGEFIYPEPDGSKSTSTVFEINGTV